ncbi:MAG: hypothetical protein NT076_00760 [Candidatus Pacearchaeota archaeon]|nr:hypothetical protein [Candidatus Pacearchaeota archaeon]
MLEEKVRNLDQKITRLELMVDLKRLRQEALVYTLKLAILFGIAASFFIAYIKNDSVKNSVTDYVTKIINSLF